MSLYRVSGVVEAPDGTTYRPLFYGDYYAACRVSDAVTDGAHDRGEGYELATHRETGEGWKYIGIRSRSVPAYVATHPFEVVGELLVEVTS